nr:MAG TPA: hypothetical protein [Caudoviricetes sp.]
MRTIGKDLRNDFDPPYLKNFSDRRKTPSRGHLAHTPSF